jgi:hypothetical protein
MGCAGGAAREALTGRWCGGLPPKRASTKRDATKTARDPFSAPAPTSQSPAGVTGRVVRSSPGSSRRGAGPFVLAQDLNDSRLVIPRVVSPYTGMRHRSICRSGGGRSFPHLRLSRGRTGARTAEGAQCVSTWQGARRRGSEISLNHWPPQGLGRRLSPRCHLPLRRASPRHSSSPSRSPRLSSERRPSPPKRSRARVARP